MKKSYHLFPVVLFLFVLIAFAASSSAATEPDTMYYEIVQTNPDIGAIPPTAEAGFGSSNGGALGNLNIQKYIRTGENQGSNSIIGTWISAGENVAPLLITYFNIDSLIADFRDDMTYSVRQVDVFGVAAVLEGTWSAQETGVGNIFTITVNQSSPTVLTSEGIFEVHMGMPVPDPDYMLYEIVQTNPDIGAIPPNAEAGFGSSNGGALGNLNIQKYIRIDENQGSESIIGEWLSAGTDVAPLLVTYFNIDSIFAEFKDDMTYIVRQVDVFGVAAVLEGTWSMQESGVGKIYKIVVNQSSPTVLTSEGIFEVFTMTTDIQEPASVPDGFALHQNYPNPFNPATTIAFTLPTTSRASLTVYNAMGQRVAVLFDEIRHAGQHHIRFDASNLSNGLYIYRLEAGNYMSTRKMLLVK